MKHPYAEILHAIAEGVPVEWKSVGNGRWYLFDDDRDTLPFKKDKREWRIKPQPRTGTFWANIYPEIVASIWSTREDADHYSAESRIACVEVKWTEGEGL